MMTVNMTMAMVTVVMLLPRAVVVRMEMRVHSEILLRVLPRNVTEKYRRVRSMTPTNSRRKRNLTSFRRRT